MNDEEMQRRMEFIINQQAQLVVNQQKAEERMTRIEDGMTRMEDAMLRLTTSTENIFIGTTEIMADLAAAQVRTEATVGDLGEKMVALTEAQTRLAESQAHTDQRLDALIDIIREWRNGKSQG